MFGAMRDMDRDGYWTVSQLRHQAAVLRGQATPTRVLMNARYLNTYLKTWERANIWLDGDRIVYVGDRSAAKMDRATEITDCSDFVLVPGYIEPHIHPGQLYNPLTLAAYAAPLGTTTLICDNAILFREMSDEAAFRAIAQLAQLPVQFYWWFRYDAQTEGSATLFNDKRIHTWLHHPLVVQGGELTGWPKVVRGDDGLLSWMRETKVLRKPIESHLPGASERTLTQLKLFGADCDHEAMTGEEAVMRLKLGYTVSLRYSSIRPDLPDMLKSMLTAGVRDFDHVLMNMDGATPAFLKQGICDRLVRIALDAGVPTIDAYMMVSANVAAHYNLNDRIGHIAPGRLANINFLRTSADPRPAAVLSKGQWLRRGAGRTDFPASGWQRIFGAARIDCSLTERDLDAASLVGIDMVNDVITRPFTLEMADPLPAGVLYLTLADREGKWRVNAYLRGFARDLSGLASSFSATGDLLLIGRSKPAMIAACRRVKAIGGGLVLMEHGRPAAELALPVLGCMSALPIERLIPATEQFEAALRRAGYTLGDPFFSLLFLPATHLPYIRITPAGLYDVMGNKLITGRQ